MSATDGTLDGGGGAELDGMALCKAFPPPLHAVATVASAMTRGTSHRTLRFETPLVSALTAPRMSSAGGERARRHR